MIFSWAGGLADQLLGPPPPRPQLTGGLLALAHGGRVEALLLRPNRPAQTAPPSAAAALFFAILIEVNRGAQLAANAPPIQTFLQCDMHHGVQRGWEFFPPPLRSPQSPRFLCALLARGRSPARGKPAGRLATPPMPAP